MLPEYQCHKKVRAAKIVSITHCPAKRGQPTGKCIIMAGDVAIGTSWGWVANHGAQVGGYYVRYEDGYESYSPAAAFESGYSRCDIPPVPTPVTGSSVYLCHGHGGYGFVRDCAECQKNAFIGARRSEPAYAGPNSIHRDANWPIERRKSQRHVDITCNEFIKRRMSGPGRRTGGDRRRAKS